jgi:hypothetical protein
MGTISYPETLVTANKRCVTFEKSEDLIHTAVEASNAHTFVLLSALYVNCENAAVWKTIVTLTISEALQNKALRVFK